jgi:hypothetical protein
MWRWKKVTRADIPVDVRQQLERYGEDVLAQGIAHREQYIKAGGDFPALLRTNYNAALDWLNERRDIHENREDRLMAVEVAILVFVVMGVIVESVELVSRLAGH